MDEATLINAVFQAHALAAAHNPSLSREVFIATNAATGDPVRAAIAALSTFGVGLHGPISSARHWVYRANERDRRAFALTNRLPGFGHAFFKDKVDPSFQPVVDILKGTDEYGMLLHVQRELFELRNRMLPVNAAGLTACAAEVLNMGNNQELQLALPGRVRGWCVLI